MTAEYRSVQTRMWREDEWFQNQPTDARLLFIYLFTNPSASVSGIYRLPLRTIVFESGIPAERVNELLAQFSQENKAHVEDGVVWVVKMRENQLPGRILSDKIITHLEGEIAKIPPCRLKNKYLQAYGYPIDTLSIPMCTDTIPKPETNTGTNFASDDADLPFSDPPTPAPKKEKVKPAPKETNPAQREMFGAIRDTCELNGELHASRIGKTARELLAAGYTPEQVRGFKDWWLADSWRAEHTPVPTIAKLIEKLEQFKNAADKPRPVFTNSTNGRGQSKVDRSLAAVDEVRQMLKQQEVH